MSRDFEIKEVKITLLEPPYSLVYPGKADVLVVMRNVVLRTVQPSVLTQTKLFTATRMLETRLVMQ